MIRQLKLEFAFQGEVRQILMDVIYSRRKTLGLGGLLCLVFAGTGGK